MAFLASLLDVTLEAAPWLLGGLFVAGLVKAWIPQERIAEFLGGRGFRPIINGALIGVPLPICSCGVLPLAVGLRRGGASPAATSAFLVSTPETGVDSISLSFGMLGPAMAIARPIAALFSAVATGLLMATVPSSETMGPADDGVQIAPGCGSSECSESMSTADCCDAETTTADDAQNMAFWERTMAGLRYAFGEIFDDVAVWLIIGLVFAAGAMTWIPPQALGAVGGGIVPMLLLVVVGIPMYICATASTPVAAALLAAGVSPGATMVFLLVGPATNIATLGVVKNEFGKRAVCIYLTGIIGASLIAGLVMDVVVMSAGINIVSQLSDSGEILPEWLAIGSAVVFCYLAIPPVLSRVRSTLHSFKGRNSTRFFRADS